MTLETFIDGFLGASAIEMTASIAGFICVLLIIRGSIWNFAFGLVQVTLFAWVFYTSKLYSDAMLHLVYIALQIYGFWNWSKHQGSQSQLIIHGTSLRTLLFWIVVSIATAIGLGFVMDTQTDASFAYADAFTTCTSLVAMWLMSRRHLFNWLFWIVVDVVAIVIYLQKGLFPTSVLYVTFLIMSCIGQYTWWKKYQVQLVTLR